VVIESYRQNVKLDGTWTDGELSKSDHNRGAGESPVKELDAPEFI